MVNKKSGAKTTFLALVVAVPVVLLLTVGLVLLAVRRKLPTKLAVACTAWLAGVRLEARQRDLVDLAITSCPNCFQGYRLSEWKLLTFVSYSGKCERRKCLRCNTVLKTDPSIASKVNLKVTRELYEKAYRNR